MNEQIAGLIRHFLTAAGATLVTKGYIDATGLELVAGAIATIAGVAWSVFSKRKAK